MQKISKNIKDTQKIAKKFLLNLKPHKKRATMVALYGDLGAGKTTFTQFVAREMKVGRKVNSPTFVIMKKYSLPKILPFRYIFHLDAYRLKNEKELFHIGWNEIISNKEHLVFVEWPESVIKALPKKHHKVYISHTKEGYRKFQIKKG